MADFRAALAVEAVGPSDEDILRELADIADENILVEHTGDVVDAGRRLLARHGSAPRPVPVSERLPGPEDCDAEGWCWWWDNVEGSWYLQRPSIPVILCPADLQRVWLPAHALPIPQENAND